MVNSTHRSKYREQEVECLLEQPEGTESGYEDPSIEEELLHGQQVQIQTPMKDEVTQTTKDSGTQTRAR